MGKLFFGIVVVIASLVLVESLTCNKCNFSVFGFCLGSGTVDCTGSDVCYTGKATFPNISSSFSGFSNQGCRANTTCENSSGTILGVPYNSNITCCSTDKCNTVNLSGAAPSTKMTFTAAITGAMLASVLGSML